MDPFSSQLANDLENGFTSGVPEHLVQIYRELTAWCELIQCKIDIDMNTKDNIRKQVLSNNLLKYIQSIWQTKVNEYYMPKRNNYRNALSKLYENHKNRMNSQENREIPVQQDMVMMECTETYGCSQESSENTTTENEINFSEYPSSSSEDSFLEKKDEEEETLCHQEYYTDYTTTYTNPEQLPQDRVIENSFLEGEIPHENERDFVILDNSNEKVNSLEIKSCVNSFEMNEEIQQQNICANQVESKSLNNKNNNENLRYESFDSYHDDDFFTNSTEISKKNQTQYPYSSSNVYSHEDVEELENDLPIENRIVRKSTVVPKKVYVIEEEEEKEKVQENENKIIYLNSSSSEYTSSEYSHYNLDDDNSSLSSTTTTISYIDYSQDEDEKEEGGEMEMNINEISQKIKIMIINTNGEEIEEENPKDDREVKMKTKNLVSPCTPSYKSGNEHLYIRINNVRTEEYDIDSPCLDSDSIISPNELLSSSTSPSVYEYTSEKVLLTPLSVTSNSTYDNFYENSEEDEDDDSSSYLDELTPTKSNEEMVTLRNSLSPNTISIPSSYLGSSMKKDGVEEKMTNEDYLAKYLSSRRDSGFSDSIESEVEI